MSRNFSSGNYLEATLGALAAPTPMTIAAWCKPSATALGTMFSIGDSNTGNYVALGSDGTGRVFLETATPNSDSFSVGTMGTGTWRHAAGVTSSVTNHLAYLGGVAGTADTTSVNPTTLDRTTIGALVQTGSRISPFSGAVAHCAIWNIALSAAEIAALAAGRNPLTIAKANLVGYWPVFGDSSPEPDFSGVAFPLPIGGTPTKGSDDPPVDAPPGAGSGLMPMLFPLNQFYPRQLFPPMVGAPDAAAVIDNRNSGPVVLSAAAADSVDGRKGASASANVVADTAMSVNGAKAVTGSASLSAASVTSTSGRKGGAGSTLTLCSALAAVTARKGALSINDTDNWILNSGVEVNATNVVANGGGTFARVAGGDASSFSIQVNGSAVSDGATWLGAPQTCQAGDSVTVSAKVKGNVGGERIMLCISERTATGGFVRDTFSSVITINTAFQKFSFTAILGAGTFGVHAKVVVGIAGAITWFVDNVAIAKTVPSINGRALTSASGSNTSIIGSSAAMSASAVTSAAGFKSAASSASMSAKAQTLTTARKGVGGSVTMTVRSVLSTPARKGALGSFTMTGRTITSTAGLKIAAMNTIISARALTNVVASVPAHAATLTTAAATLSVTGRKAALSGFGGGVRPTARGVISVTARKAASATVSITGRTLTSVSVRKGGRASIILGGVSKFNVTSNKGGRSAALVTARPVFILGRHVYTATPTVTATAVLFASGFATAGSHELRDDLNTGRIEEATIGRVDGPSSGKIDEPRTGWIS